MKTDRMMQFFAYAHLRDDLKAVSQPFGELAQRIVDTLPSNPERTVALRKLLEAKDCAVRAFLEPAPTSPYPPKPEAPMTGPAPHDGLMAEPSKLLGPADC